MQHIETIILFIISLIGTVFIYLPSRKHPTYFEVDDKKEKIIIYVWSVSRIKAGGYSEFVYAKRKNGKYYRRISFWDWIFYGISIMFLIPVVAIVGSKLDIIIKYPDLILLNILLMLAFAIWIAEINHADIAARIYYKRHIKGKTYKELKKKQH